MKRIILPTDFSENARHAMFYTLNMFKKDRVEWMLLHVYGADIYASATTMGLQAETAAVEQLKENALRKLDGLKTELEAEFSSESFVFTPVLKYNFLPDAIQDLDREKPVYMVALGTQGATGAKEFFLGSNAVRVMEKVKECVVMVIPEKCPVVTPRKIALATTYTTLPQVEQMEILVDIMLRLNASVTMIHISDRVSLNPDQKKHRAWLQERLTASDPAIYTLDKDNVQEAIKEYVETTNTDIIGIISRKHSFFENLVKRSTLKELGYHSEVPLLVLHHQ